MNTPRANWAHTLAALPAHEIRAAAEHLERTHEVEDVSLPQAGLGLLQLRDGAFHEPFYLGEVPLTRAHVRVRTEDGSEASGGAVLLDDRMKLVRSLAILDAVLAARLPGWEIAAELVERGAAQHAEMTAQRQIILARTRVDFSLLGQTNEEDDDE